MSTPISPGVYTTITDLSAYVGAVPSTIGLICSLTKKGEDNVLKFIGGRAEYISEFGEPNINDYGKNYGQGPYCSYNYLGESGSLYHIRCMPDDASFANMQLNVNLSSTDSTAEVEIVYNPSTDINTIAEIRTALQESTDVFPLCVLYPIGRGEYYNSLSLRFTDHANPMYQGIYVLDIYETQSDGSEVIIESFEVSFDPNAKDTSGDSIWIQYILNNYSSILRCEMTLDGDDEFTSGYDSIVRVYDKEIGTVSVDISSGSATITDTKQVFTDWVSTAPYTYAIEIVDQRGNKLQGWIGGSSTADTAEIYNSRLTGGTQAWLGDTSVFDTTGEITYVVKKSFTSVASAFTSSEPVPLKNGSDGSLINTLGQLDTTVATQILSQGYLGQLTSKLDGSTMVDEVLDNENVYFSMVFDCGYPSDVKTSISTLVQTRRDAVAIIDNGDNSSYSAAMTKRTNTHVFNNYFTAIYEEYSKVYDSFTGQDVWFSPIYHMSYLLPRNDNVAEVWFAAAGFNRAPIENIKELRFNPRLGQRDQMYLKQLNPIVKFNPGYTVWGQLTSQARPSALQDLNIVRLVLYCKRALEEYCRYFIFEQNDAITWGQVSGGIVEFLDDIRSRRGLYSFNVEVGATPYEIKTKTFHVNVTLEPTRVAEKISLNFFIK